MENQLRDNDSKPKLSYFFANRSALLVCAKYFDGEIVKFIMDETQGRTDFLLAGTIANISVYLGAGPKSLSKGLVSAIIDTVLLLELDAIGSLTHVVTDRELLGFLCSAASAIDEYCAVCVWGEATKYSRGNYRLGAPVTQYCDSALRHVRAYGRGEKLDPESGRPHLGHVLWNLWQALDQPFERDDRLERVQSAPDTLREREPDVQVMTLHPDDPEFRTKMLDLIHQITGIPVDETAPPVVGPPPSSTVT